MKDKVSLLAVLLLFILPSAHAEVITPGEARAIALQHAQEDFHAQSRRGIPTSATLAEPITLSTDGTAVLYVFNRLEGGYIIVSAESDTRREVLGWSDSGSYDPACVPAPLKAVLDSYADGIRRLRNASSAERELLAKAQEHASKAPQLRRAGDLPSQVEPLLGTIEWGQGDPYARLVPTYMSNGYEYHYPTGCVATAIAQVMRYHRWPEQGRGNYSYEWNGQTLSADFNHPYRWDLMLPSYLGNYTEEQALEVARLMYDVGVSVDMYYNESGSGANFSGPRMVEFFDYDKNMKRLDANYCSTEDWEAVLRSELAAARPVLCSGGSQSGAHEFVCDGYDAEGLFHYNFGWNGAMNGWFASTATGYDASPSIDYGIEKNHGGKGALSLMSCDDFVWTSGNDFVGDLMLDCSGLDYSTSTMTIEVALAAQNVQTGQVTYHAKQSYTTTSLYLMSLSFNDDLSDGTYEVYPVGRLAGEEWQTFYHNAMRQIVVDLTVSGGVKTWANNHILDPIDEGVVNVDGIYYLLDEQNGVATVTRRNERGNSYKGDVVVPDEVTFEGSTYTVTAIGERAFEDCADLNSLVVGKNVAIIDFGALGSAGLRSITFAEGSQLRTIGGWAFNGCFFLKECYLPEGLTTIDMCAFQSCSGMLNFSIPSTVTTIAQSAFNGFRNLLTMHVAWTSPEDAYVAASAFDGIDVSQIMLYVPKGCVERYRSHSVWGDFNIQEESGEDKINWNYDAATATLTISGSGIILWDEVTAPWATFADDIRHLVVEGNISNIPSRLFINMLLESVTLSEGVNSIGERAFWGNRKLTSVTLPKSLTSIGNYAFYNTGLKTITLPANLQTIGYYAFAYSYDLATIRCHAVTPPTLDTDVFLSVADIGRLFVPIGSDYAAWKSVLPEGWDVIYTDDVDNEGGEAEWSWMFDETSGTLTVEGKGEMPYSARVDWADISLDVRRVVLGEGIVAVSDLSFWGLDALQSVSLPSTLKVLRYGAFYACAKLNEIECKAAVAPNISGGDVFSYLPVKGTLSVPEGADYSSWMAALPAGWTISYISGGGHSDDDPLVGTVLYILGCDGSWNPAQASATLTYRAADKCYAGDIIIADSGNGNGYFCLGTVLGSDSNDWGTFNVNRLGAPYSDYVLTAGASANLFTGLDASFCASAGTHHLVVDINACILYFDCPDGIRSLTADEDEDMVYDLFGRRVTQLQPGTIYLRNGRKFIAR